MDALEIENPWTPAHQAVESSDLATLTRILDGGADVDDVCSQMTLLMHAIETEADVAIQSGESIDSALTAILLAYGADPHLAVNRETAYDWARQLGHDMATRLLDRFTPLHGPVAGTDGRSCLGRSIAP
ncbi:ankyrin repeat domain-containing protein [Streptomyces sp. NPDC018338]|uniref:ankyrin repeat domain-containing protein n=1 Tax=Streptomyces sp. NPDC018338 TaxID=3157192 RepID=UPI0033C460EC